MSAKRVFVCTISLAIDAEENELRNAVDAADFMSELLSSNLRGKVFDWGYLKVGGNYLYPQEQFVDADTYEEGGFLRS